MGKLAAEIVQKKIASLRDVEEALARQVLYGGDLVTNLLEQANGLEESALTDLLAGSHQLSAAPHGELPRSEQLTLQTVPGDVALRYGLYPLEAADGLLRIAVSGPLEEDVAQDLTFALGVELEQRVAPLVRIRQAISRDYGLPLDRRTQRVVAKLEGKPDPSPSIAPAPLADAPDISALPRPPSIAPIGLPETKATAPLYQPGSTVRVDETATPSIHDAVTKPPPDVEAKRVNTSPNWPASLGGMAEKGTTLPGMPAVEEREPAPPEPVAAEPEPQAPAAEPKKQKKPSGQYAMPAAARAAWGAEQRRALKPRSRHRGPYTAAAAEEDLFAAEDRDDALAAFFDFAAQYFDYSALFAVHGDLAEGRDARGQGASRGVVAGIGVPLDLPSSLKDVRDAGSWKLTALSGDGMDARLVKDLKRRPGKKVLLLPVSVRRRCVLIFYGDDGASNVHLDDIGDVISFAPLVSQALEGIILRRKLAARRADSSEDNPPAPASILPRAEKRSSLRAQLPAADERAEILAGALQDSIRPEPGASGAPPAVKAPEAPKPPTGVAPKPTTASPKAPTPPQGTPVRAATSPPEPTTGPVFELTKKSTSMAPAMQEPDEDAWDIPSDPMPKPLHSDQSELAPTAADASGKADDAPQISIGAAEIDVGALENEEGLPDSRSVAVAPQVPNKRYSSDEIRLPTVIVDVQQDCKKLVAQLIDGDEGVINRLADMGTPAVSALVASFPGPIVDRSNGDRRVASACGPVLKALALIGRPAIPFVVVRTNDADPKVRAWATRLLGELPGVDAAQAVVRRLGDTEAQVRVAARDAGHLLLLDDDCRTALRDGAAEIAGDTKLHQDKRLAALEALADWKDHRAVPRLARLLSLDDAVASTARSVLIDLTRQDFGSDVELWLGWWDRNEHRHRIEWLIDALMHEDAGVRRAAGEELKILTKEYFGYYDDLPKAERAHAQQRYREWWEAHGKARFGE